MNAAARIGFLGGTLDPIHMGHLETARVARAALLLYRVEIVPSRIPPHRHLQPCASPFHRFAMAALAVNGVDGLTVSDMELAAPGPSYTADTLTRLHATGLTASQIFFIVGADAFAEIETWARYPAVVDLAHFIVISRPGYPLTALADRLPALAPRMTHELDRLDFLIPQFFLVEADTPDVSSTEVRRCIARREPLTGLVPPAVEAHIVQHALCGSAGLDLCYGQNREASHRVREHRSG
jgi:nicotinate-nucleotide adenylyltransferase